MSTASPGPSEPPPPPDPMRASPLAEIDAAVVTCRRCPRLVAWREEVAVVRRRAYADEQYWARPLAGFGDPGAGIVVLGLAPAAHGGNRTGRVFTGDRSGDWLFAALHRAGLATQPTSTHIDDGLELSGCRIVAAVRCAPPANRPTPGERDTCGYWLDAELEALAGAARVVVVLGGFAWDAGLRSLGRLGFVTPRPRPVFGHGREAVLARPAGDGLTLLGCYHVSQQNTFTGRLTEDMLDAVLDRAVALSGVPRD